MESPVCTNGGLPTALTDRQQWRYDGRVSPHCAPFRPCILVIQGWGKCIEGLQVHSQGMAPSHCVLQQ